MKTIATLASLPLLILSPQSTHAFDSTRFSSEVTQTGRVPAYAKDRPSPSPPVEFLLDRSGRLNPPADGSEANTFGSQSGDFALPSSDRPHPAPTQHSRPDLNTLYSLSDLRYVREDCGPSPLSPAQIEALVGRTADAYGVDAVFAKAITWTESRFDQVRNSPTGARGPMQLMPDTARELSVSDVCDPASNIDAGVRRLKALLDEFRNPLLAAAAYNAGAQAIYDNGGVPPYPETVRYVASVINRQLGLEMPHTKTPDRRGPAGKLPATSTDQVSDVIGAKGSQFVNGVMHF
ncbi:lytic transglycosylase domain-containing protein [Neorhizobium galegae]|uniref:lytic transglycosylase domain-containing protein n=1 Tax=Neorhizobium galegae TaxID=399 RepID=UPI000621B28D|nr:lytic transglycosylase domain-containing protein [Neorhizobium galegae]CDZ55185.1 Lytic transglycosylase catalytic [Neorhizobium galegae bv. orientalis]